MPLASIMTATTMSVPQRFLVALVRAYRFALSPWLGTSCRFVPSCSAFSLQALQTHGAATGTYLTLGRLMRCHPWCAGGHDPVPERPAALFSALVPAKPRPDGAPFNSSTDKTAP